MAVERKKNFKETGRPDEAARLLANISIVLKEPKFAENIGAAARSAYNMGVSSLFVVRAEPPDREKMLKMATHNAAHLIENMELHEDLGAALAPFSWVVGTTARQGRQRRSRFSPRDMVDEILPLLQKNRVALLFGPEDRGLANDDLRYCNMLTTVPTADFSSLNLAQAVAIHCYELYMGLLAASGTGKKRFVPKLAANDELEAMYAHVEEALCGVGFLKSTDSAYWMRNIREFLGRIGLRAKEARVIRGVCRQLLWYDKKVSRTREKDGRPS